MTPVSVEFFARSPLLARIEDGDLRALVRRAEQRAFAPGQLLFQRGDAGDGVFCIVSGHVKVYLEGQDGGEVIVATRTTGDVIGELSLLDHHRRSASAAAVDSVKVARISTANFEEWLMEHPAAAIALLHELAQRVRETTDQVAEIAILSIDTRIARRLWMHFAEASPDATPRVGMKVRVNQAQLASVVGITRESVNKHLRRLKESRVIAIESGKVELLDAGALRELTQGL
jgi:CRP-like cAMP-binding protein